MVFCFRWAVVSLASKYLWVSTLKAAVYVIKLSESFEELAFWRVKILSWSTLVTWEAISRDSQENPRRMSRPKYWKREAGERAGYLSDYTQIMGSLKRIAVQWTRWTTIPYQVKVLGMFRRKIRCRHEVLCFPKKDITYKAGPELMTKNSGVLIVGK